MYKQNQKSIYLYKEFNLANLSVRFTQIVFGLTVDSKVCLSSSKPRIFFSNHTSHLDFLLMWSSLPVDVRRMTVAAAAADYWCKNWVRRWIAENIFDSIMIERASISRNNNPVTAIIYELDKGKSVIIFPEGGRSDGPDIEALKSGLFHIARKRPDIELIPAYIHNANRVLPKGFALPVPVMCSVTFGNPIVLLPDENKMEFSNRARLELEKCRAA